MRTDNRGSFPAVIPSIAILMLGLVACGGGQDANTAKAEAVFSQTMAASPEYTTYAISIASGTRSDYARQQVIDLVSSDQYRTALAAARGLADDPPEQARAALQAVFDSKGGALKLQAAVALARLEDGAALEWLRQEISSGGVALSLPAVLVMAENGDVETVTAQIKQYMDSEDLSTRNEAYGILGAAGQPWATEMLLKGLNQERGEDRQQAISALGRSGDPEAAYEIIPFTNTRGLVFASLEALGRLGEPGTASAVEEMTAHEEKTVRIYAAVAAWRLGNAERAVEVLEPLLNDEDVVMRSLVAEQLEGVEDPRAREWLVGLAEDPDKAVRLAALRSLATGASAADGAAFLKATADREYEVVTVALNVLAGLPLGREEIALIEPLMDSDNPYVAISAAHAVLALGESVEGSQG